ncbi:amino acid adenylation domain-containing protein [Streptomyces mirabilis]|uniref:amino acid adenylation domain-containing protein n=1 Tax=Streptomyces mirabilis TaxID=68239 RepID=UPI00198B52CD|nr:amino acid adenylation domain-containing protein [Streptomyces mirabilis]GHD49129.1 amino acid adenylation protein [Streptomyces mirabilis]
MRPLPDRRAHELFEECARNTPSATAAVHRDTRWTYAELDAAADRVAGALLTAGLRPEGVVAVISQRSLDWLAAILGIFKAGGVYLPIDPAYPDERIADLLRRSGSKLALVEGEVSVRPVEAAAVDALPLVPAQALEARPDRVPDDALAYIYFTSGSTGAPKGAACEHAGMINHLLAKVDTFGLAPGTVVAQTASQCFDISLWQAISPLIVGGSTVIIDPETMLDVPGLLQLLARENVGVLQLVPSYLDVIVTRLERGDIAPGSLRMLGVTGEAVSQQVLTRWFKQCPEVPVVNAYGATEASDDTTHEVIRSMAEDDQVTVGVPIANVLVDVVGEDGLPVEDDTIGEVTFSGVCVGRGYINDPERTAEAFGADPVRPGLRRYRTGDYGHWLPDGRLRFVGRRDEQVKISGVRVEVGEVEAQLFRVPGVRSACVIVMPDGASKRLAGFYTAASPIADVGDMLAKLLPVQLVPRTLRWLPELPLTDNGKVDKRGLADLETNSASGNSVTPPQTATERRIATAWAEVLGLPLDEVGRRDDFFEHGGGSLAAVRLVVQLGGLISLVDLMAHPVLADLAAAADGADSAEGADSDDSPLLQALSVPENATAALVCVPYEAGNALNFAAMARELSASGMAVYAVELPGHDVARPDDELVGLDQIAGRLIQEIRDRIELPVALWGHGAGVALALEAGRSLQAAGVPPLHLFLAAAAQQDTADAEPASAKPGDIGAWLRDVGALTDVDQWRSTRGELIERAYRHDLGEAERYLGAVTGTLDLPVTVILIPRAPGESDVAARCTAVIPSARITGIEGAGRYLVRSHPAAAADLVTATLATTEEGGTR